MAIISRSVENFRASPNVTRRRGSRKFGSCSAPFRISPCGVGARPLHWRIMIRAFQMIFSPGPAWTKVAEKNRNFLFTLFLSTLPLIFGCLAIEAYGLERLGESIGEFG